MKYLSHKPSLNEVAESYAEEMEETIEHATELKKSSKSWHPPRVAKNYPRNRHPPVRHRHLKRGVVPIRQVGGGDGLRLGRKNRPDMTKRKRKTMLIAIIILGAVAGLVPSPRRRPVHREELPPRVGLRTRHRLDLPLLKPCA